MKDILYKTQRLIIRKWVGSDADDLFEYCSNPEITKFLRFQTYTSRNEAVERITKMHEIYKAHENGDKSECIDYAIALGDKVIGSIGIVRQEPTAGGIIELGYILNPKFQGAGYMTEALVGMFKYIKQNKLAMRIAARFNTLNPASGEVMKRAGMTYEGILRKAGEDNHCKRADMAIYSILIEEVVDN